MTDPASQSELRARFVDDLAASGTVADPALLAAFRDIPRDAFVPYYFRSNTGRRGWRLVEPASREWLEGVYSMDALITQLDGDDAKVTAARADGSVDGVATSSSSAPTLMALMLQALDLHDGHNVLEVGTGSGYNTALLCHRLGAENVTTVDLDPGLVARARERLAVFDYWPHAEGTDGLRGCRDRAPFDRVIATVGLRRIPPAWLAQSRPGARMLVPLDLGGAAGLLALLTVHENGTASGSFLPDYGGFMPTRDNQRPATAVLPAVAADDGQTRETSLSADLVTDSRGAFEFFGALRVCGYDWLGFTPADGRPAQTWLTQANGSWACHTTDEHGTHTVRQGGPRLLWNGLEDAHHEWERLGQPVRERFGLIVGPGEQTAWLDEPTSPYRWPLG